MSTSNSILIGAFLVGIIGLFLYSNYVSSNKPNIASQVGNEFDELFKGIGSEGNNTNATSQSPMSGLPIALPKGLRGLPIALPWGLGMPLPAPSVTFY